MSYFNEPWKRILDFWFDPENKPYWFRKSEDFDNKMHNEFYDTWQAACKGELSSWRSSLDGRLAEIIVLDQFSRNLCRGKECAFTQDEMAQSLSREAVEHDDFNKLSMDEKKFILMPFMHSESLDVHKQAVELFKELGDEETLKFEILHKDIIEKFGRYPHRNESLNRKSTLEEIEFLKQPGSSF